MTSMDDRHRPECFVAMWFGSDEDSRAEMDQLFEIVIGPAVRSHNLVPYRVDRDLGADRLDTDILAAIDRSVLVVADLTHDPKTGLRGSVIFEAGYAYKTKSVVWMCRSNLSDSVPFDMRQFRQIRWDPNRLKVAEKELARVIAERFRVRQQERADHEIARFITCGWNQMSHMQDFRAVGMPDEPNVTKDQQRMLRFEDMCDDIRTRAKYKPMGLSEDERYELIEHVRVFRKFTDMAKSQKGAFDAKFYNTHVLPRLRASGWLAEGTKPMPR